VEYGRGVEIGTTKVGALGWKRWRPEARRTALMGIEEYHYGYAEDGSHIDGQQPPGDHFDDAEAFAHVWQYNTPIL
jgi:hypothetical protein